MNIIFNGLLIIESIPRNILTSNLNNHDKSELNVTFKALSSTDSMSAQHPNAESILKPGKDTEINMLRIET